jgi:TRAP-type C4-dicarboxylate transport system permease small subunit
MVGKGHWRRLERYVGWTLSGATGLMILYSCFEIFTRFAFGSQFLFCNDLVLMTIVMVLFVSAIYTVQTGGATSIDLILNRLTGRSKTVYEIILNALSGGICLLLGVSSLILSHAFMKLHIPISNVLPLPGYLPILALATGMFGCSTIFFIRVVIGLRTLRC